MFYGLKGKIIFLNKLKFQFWLNVWVQSYLIEKYKLKILFDINEHVCFVSRILSLRLIGNYMFTSIIFMQIYDRILRKLTTNYKIYKHLKKFVFLNLTVTESTNITILCKIINCLLNNNNNKILV